MGVALPADLGGLQDAGVTQLDQNLLPVELAGLAVVVGFDAADKVRLSGHHLGQQVHERELGINQGQQGSTGRFQNKSIRTHSEVGGHGLRAHVGGFSRVVRRFPRLTRLKHTTEKTGVSPLKVSL